VNTTIEIIPNTEECYTPLVDFEAWRVAGLNHCDIVDIDHLARVERHLETDEVFLLTAGRASLIVERGNDGKGAPDSGSGESGPAGHGTGRSGSRGESFEVIPMEPNTVYNVKKGVYHHVILERDASIIIVENSDTSTDNSEYRELWEEEIAGIKRSVEGIR
jgi:hypothetical protein